VKKGDQLGKIRFVAQDATIAEIPLFATEDVAESDFIDRAIDTIRFMAFGG
ncbi:MAG: D-alanyl-D-alanine carboxypeptidase, partial [Hyphomicrobiales bacterium]